MVVDNQGAQHVQAGAHATRCRPLATGIQVRTSAPRPGVEAKFSLPLRRCNRSIIDRTPHPGAAQRLSDIESPTIVGDDDLDPPTSCGERDGDSRRGDVSDRVGPRLVEDPQQLHLQLRVDRRRSFRRHLDTHLVVDLVF
jgi:hypothetical protein